MTEQHLTSCLNYAKKMFRLKTDPALDDQDRFIWQGNLGEFSLREVIAAIDLVSQSHEYPTMPSIGVIRREAVNLRRQTLTGDEAFRLVWVAVRHFGSGQARVKRNGEWTDIDRTKEGLASLHPALAYAAEKFGWQLLCDTGPEYMAIRRKEFISFWETLDRRGERLAMMPPAVKELAGKLQEKLAEKMRNALET